ncbi:Pycsar system effector family protein [Streptomyces omiyaensis]|uniref:Pycsar system effector family protein n=1 Tax=Streptomyces omiyaensis TaxID=68247 RepID=A0ABW7C3T5_9ACTN
MRPSICPECPRRDHDDHDRAGPRLGHARRRPRPHRRRPQPHRHQERLTPGPDGLLVAALSLAGTDLACLSLLLAVLAATVLVGSVVLALLVIRPRLDPGGDRSGFICLATADPAAITETLAADHRVAQLQALARIAPTKMKLLRLAGDITLVAVPSAISPAAPHPPPAADPEGAPP